MAPPATGMHPQAVMDTELQLDPRKITKGAAISSIPLFSLILILAAFFLGVLAIITNSWYVWSSNDPPAVRASSAFSLGVGGKCFLELVSGDDRFKAAFDVWKDKVAVECDRMACVAFGFHAISCDNMTALSMDFTEDERDFFEDALCPMARATFSFMIISLVAEVVAFWLVAFVALRKKPGFVAPIASTVVFLLRFVAILVYVIGVIEEAPGSLDDRAAYSGGGLSFWMAVTSLILIFVAGPLCMILVILTPPKPVDEAIPVLDIPLHNVVAEEEHGDKWNLVPEPGAKIPEPSAKIPARPIEGFVPITADPPRGFAPAPAPAVVRPNPTPPTSAQWALGNAPAAPMPPQAMQQLPTTLPPSGPAQGFAQPQGYGGPPYGSPPRADLYNAAPL